MIGSSWVTVPTVCRVPKSEKKNSGISQVNRKNEEIFRLMLGLPWKWLKVAPKLEYFRTILYLYHKLFLNVLLSSIWIHLFYSLNWRDFCLGIPKTGCQRSQYGRNSQLQPRVLLWALNIQSVLSFTVHQNYLLRKAASWRHGTAYLKRQLTRHSGLNPKWYMAK